MDAVETGESKSIWGGAFEGYDFGQNAGRFAICARVFDISGQMSYGIYLFLPDKPRQFIPIDGPCAIFYRGTPTHQFIMQKLDVKYSFSYVSNDGKLLPDTIDGVVDGISPDNR